jgi:hypothetical protein
MFCEILCPEYRAWNSHLHRHFYYQMLNVTLSSLFYMLLAARLSMTNLTHSSFFLHVYFNPLHVSSNLVLIIRRINCINTTSGICHYV